MALPEGEVFFLTKRLCASLHQDWLTKWHGTVDSSTALGGYGAVALTALRKRL